MIKLSHVWKTYSNKYSKVEALKDVCLEINDGETVAIVGASGSGKTTLLNILGCMDTSDQGEYFFDQTNINQLHGKKLDGFRKKTIGFVFQQFALLSNYTVLENVEVPLRAQNIGRGKRKKIAEKWLEKVGIAECANQFPSMISGGQQQRCAIARALATGAPLILADEPTGALDSQTGQEIITLLYELSKLNKTVILVTHDEKVSRQAGRVIRLSDGKLADDTKLQKN